MNDLQEPPAIQEMRREFDLAINRALTCSAAERPMVIQEIINLFGSLCDYYISVSKLDEAEQVLTRTWSAIGDDADAFLIWSFHQGCLLNECGQLLEAFTVLQYLLNVLNELFVLDELFTSSQPQKRNERLQHLRILRVRVLNAIGINLNYQEQYDDAIDAYQQSVKLCEELQSTKIYQEQMIWLRQANALRNIGIVYFQLMEYDEAERLFRSSLALADQGEKIAPHVAQRSRAMAFVELGVTYKERAKWDQAGKYLDRALEIFQTLREKDSIARTQNNIGELQLLQGEVLAAEQSFVQAAGMIGDNNKRQRADILANRGLVYAIQGDYEKAATDYKEALHLAIEVHSDFLISQILFRQGDLWRKQENHIQAYQVLEEAIQTIERMLPQAKRTETRISVIGSRQQIYQTMVLECITLERLDEALFYAERSRSRTFLDIKTPSPNDGQPEVDTVLSLTNIQAQLPKGAVLVEFFTTWPVGPSKDLLDHLPSEAQGVRKFFVPDDKLFAFIITRHSLEIVEYKGITSRMIRRRYFTERDGRLQGIPVDGMISRSSIEGQASGSSLSEMNRWHDLHELLFVPLQDYLVNKQHIFLIPHGDLHYLPLHALASSGELVNTTYTTISYASSASVLLASKLSPTPSDLRTTAICLSIGVNADGLQHSEAEAVNIAKPFKFSRVIKGPEARLPIVLTALSVADIIHISSHGQYIAHAPMLSSLQLYGGDKLTAQDVLNTPLKARIVTLSACETGWNKLLHGDELIGFTRAFLGAGAHTLVVSLWQIDEVPTRLFMETFYDAWRAGKSPAKAIQLAQRFLRQLTKVELESRLIKLGFTQKESGEIIKSYKNIYSNEYPLSHPYYWAGFLLFGNPY